MSTTPHQRPAPMTDADVADLVAYANQLDGRVTITPARQDLWALNLRHYGVEAARAAVLAYYSQPLPDGMRERRPVEPHDLRRLAGALAPRCADHPDYPATRCLTCWHEVQAGDRPAGAIGYARPNVPAVGSGRARLAAIMAGVGRGPQVDQGLDS